MSDLCMKLELFEAVLVIDLLLNKNIYTYTRNKGVYWGRCALQSARQFQDTLCKGIHAHMHVCVCLCPLFCLIFSLAR